MTMGGGSRRKGARTKRNGGPLARPGVTVAAERVAPDEEWGRQKQTGGKRGARPPPRERETVPLDRIR